MKDLIGDEILGPVFVDIGNQRDAVAKEKAELALKLNRLCKTVPPRLNAAGVELVRKWKSELKTCQRVLANKSASRQQLASAINALEKYL